jgi:hypothetical protein
MKCILVSFVLLLAGFLQAQTRLIAHKSHSGGSESYRFETAGNFGNYEPPVTLKQVEKINDTTVILTQETMGKESTDTIYHHPIFSNPNMTAASLKRGYYKDVKFKNFDPKKQHEAPASVAPVSNPKKKKKHVPARIRADNSLLLLLLGGGVFVGMGLITTIGRKRKPQDMIHA